MASAPAKIRTFYVLALAVPFMTNLIIRVYAVKLFVGMDGPLQWFLQTAHIPYDPYALSQNTVLVFYGMITSYLPFMVFPLYAALEKFDFSLVEAAQDLGASNAKILFGVIIPNTRVAALNSFALVFIPCLGEFVIPDLLGGAKSMLAGNLITEQFLKTRDWPFGAALSVGLIALLLTTPFILRRIFLGRPRVQDGA
jgi:spermidine/putrescine transport system permease protein